MAKAAVNKKTLFAIKLDLRGGAKVLTTS